MVLRYSGVIAVIKNSISKQPVLTAENNEDIRRCMDEKSDITIEEIREKLNLSASYSTVERAIGSMSYTLKKKSLYASERDRDRVRCAGEAQRMERNHKT